MEDIKNMNKKELLDYLESISKQLDNIALDQIPIAIAELQFQKKSMLGALDKILEQYKTK